MNRAFIFFFLLSASVFAGDQKPGADAWLTYYYQHPQPDRFVAEVTAMSMAKDFARPSARPPMIAFLGRIMAQNPDKIAAWMASLGDLPAGDREVLYAALWFSGTPEGTRYLEANGIKEFAGRTPPDILKMEIDSPAVLDMLWAWFFATGQDEAVRRVVSALNLSQYDGALERYKTSPKTEQTKREAYLDTTFHSAEWSLTNNCGLHPKVKEICERLFHGETLTKTEKTGLAMVLAKSGQTALTKGNQVSDPWMLDGNPVQEKPNMKSKDGFGAQLFLTESTQFFEDWNKPDPPQLVPLTRVMRDARFYTVLLFADPGVDPAGAASVTCSIVIHAPDGTVYAKTGELVCWQGKYPAQPHNLQLSQGSMANRIDPKAKPGVYTVEVTMRDNIKKVELPLQTTFEVQ